MITTVVFDLDDTLYDEIDYCKSGFRAAADFFATLPETPTAERIFDCLWNQFTSGNRKRIFNAALDQLGAAYDSKLIESAVKVYRSHTPKITLPADSRDTLSRLSDKYTLALLTDGFLPAQKLKVQALGIEKYFKCIVYTEQLGRDCWKPAPAGFEKLMRTLNTSPESIVYVADNQMKDFIAPNRLGFLTVQIIRPAGLHTESSEQSDAAAQYVIRKIRQLPELLERL